MSLRFKLLLGLLVVLLAWGSVVTSLECALLWDLPRSYAGLLAVVMLETGVMTLLVVVAVMALRRVLQPVAQLAEAAEEIVRSGSLSRPLPIPEANDEAGRVAAAFNELIRKVDALVANQRRLLADTSHELRNPLTVIRTNVDLLGRDLDAEMRREVAAETEAEIARMARMVDDLVKLSTAETTPPAHREAIRIDTLAVEVVDRIRSIASQRTLTTEVKAHAIVQGDADRLRQILTNLVSNAVRYTSSGGTIHVTVTHTDGKARVTVQDDGIGIPARHVPHIFDRFYRVDEARNRASGGAGLGLPIALALAESHGGTIEVKSAEGKGSSFTLVLPAQLAAGQVTTRMPRVKGAP